MRKSAQANGQQTYGPPGSLHSRDALAVPAEFTVLEEPPGSLMHDASLAVPAKYTESDEPAPAKSKPAKAQTFKQAFRSARNAGLKTFSWRGKKYHTRTKEESAR